VVDLAVLASVVFFGLVSRRLEGTVLTAPLVQRLVRGVIVFEGLLAVQTE